MLALVSAVLHPSALQLKEHFPVHLAQSRVSFKMSFRPCASGCGSFLTSDDGHGRCLMYLGCKHSESAFMDGSCLHWKCMSMAMLRPSSSTQSGSSGRKDLEAALVRDKGDLRITVRNVPPR